MKLIILTALGVFCFVKFGESAVYINPDATDSEYPGKCVDKKLKLILDPEQTVTVRKECVRVHCGSDGRTMDYATCGKMSISKEDQKICHLSKNDGTQDYPLCCPKPVCSFDPEEDNNL